MEGSGAPILVASSAILVIAGVAGAYLISRVTGWGPAGPIALLIAAPAVPTIPLVFHVSTDDVLPAVGLGLLILRQPWPKLTRHALPRIGLAALLVITAARIAATVANETGLPDIAAGLVSAIGRPLFMVAAVAFVAATLPVERRRLFIGQAVALMGTAEAIASLVAFTIGLPGGFGVQPTRLFEDLGGCDGRIVGTLGLSPNHVGAVFVLTLPMTLAMASRSKGWQRWLWLAGAVVQAVALYYTFTRASIILGALAAVALMLINRQFRLLLAGALATFVLAVAVSSAACRTVPAGQPPSGGGAVPPPAVGERFSDPTDRPALWYSALRMTLDHPLFGVGLGGMPKAIAANPETYAKTPFGVATSSAHNTILLASAETGIIGGLATAVLNAILALLALSWLAWPRQDVHLARAAAVAVLAFLAQGMFNNLFTVPATSIPFALLIAAFIGGVGQPVPRGATLPPAPPLGATGQETPAT